VLRQTRQTLANNLRQSADVSNVSGRVASALENVSSRIGSSGLLHSALGRWWRLAEDQFNCRGVAQCWHRQIAMKSQDQNLSLAEAGTHGLLGIRRRSH
jgi:hypothetical protein